MTQYVAFIDNINGTHIVVGVNEAELVGETPAGYDDDGQEIFEDEYAMGSTATMPEESTGITVESGEIDAAFKIALDILNSNGWRIVGEWEVGDSAYYATVER